MKLREKKRVSFICSMFIINYPHYEVKIYILLMSFMNGIHYKDNSLENHYITPETKDKRQ